MRWQVYLFNTFLLSADPSAPCEAWCLVGAPEMCVVGGIINGDERLLSPQPHSHRLVVTIFTLPDGGRRGGFRQEKKRRS